MYYILSLFLLNKTLKFINIFHSLMPLIKLDAIDSTNEYLKQLSKETNIEDYTIVVANEQTNGKGQMGAKWVSEKGKNLTMSVLLKDVSVIKEEIFALNLVAALSVLNVLKNMQIPNVTIKWPNDIMSDSKKVAGILIENSFRLEGTFTAVIGIGLNLNQTDFDLLPQATSLKCITGNIYDIDNTALQIRDSLKENVPFLNQNENMLWEEYHENLFKLNYPTPFETKDGTRFMGIIQKVNNNGKLEVLHEDKGMHEYEVKEIKMLF